MEICKICGKSVSFGSGLFVDRIPDFSTRQERVDGGDPYPDGEFTCRNCEKFIVNPIRESNNDKS
jgi:hypothetical protein